MIQFNLLPDIKIQYLRANRQKHVVLLASGLVAVAAIAAMVVLATIVFGVQKKSLSDLSSDITDASNELQGTKDLNKMLTVQNQLKALPDLHDAKPVVSRLYGYLDEAIPANASNSRTLVDFTQLTMNVSGNADSLETINHYIDRLKATTYHTKEDPDAEKKAFSEVTLSSFGRDSKSATYTITFKFDEAIFNGANDVTFAIGPATTTAPAEEGDN